jgi:hypothetical protein
MNRIHPQLSSLMIILSIVLFVSATAYAGADQFIGEFIGYADDDRYYLKMNKTPDGHYKGEMNVDGEIILLSAKKQGTKIVGEMNEYGDIYQFTASIRKDGSLNFTGEDGESVIFRPNNIAGSADKSKAKQAFAAEMKSTRSSKGKSGVYINRVRLDAEKLKALETTNQTRIESGRYWYDNICGAWGVEGGPTAGFIVAGLSLPGPMPADISGGGTGIFINGREIHSLDQLGLQRLFGITYQGQYWLDARGNLGIAGGPAIVNIVAAIQASQRRQSGGSTTHGYNSTYGARGTLSGGSGGSMYSGRTAAGKSVFWYPGM